MEDFGTDEKMRLKGIYIYIYISWSLRTGFICLRIGKSAGTCGHGNESSIEDGEFLD
jgi:hypothetical protein